jgi:molecular chaperone GrpE
MTDTDTDPTRPDRPDAQAGDEPHQTDRDIRVVDRRWWARAAARGGDAADAPPSDKPSYVQELEQRLAAKDDELRATIARYREASAEFDEMRARLRRDVAKEIERGRRQVLADLLEVVDNLDRAADAARAASGSDALTQGVELVRSQFLAKLQAHGVTRVASLHERFDPTRHEAATSVPVLEEAMDGAVVGVIREGYLIGDDVLRPAMVAVGRFTHEGAHA